MIIPDQIDPLVIEGEKNRELKKKINDLVYTVNVLTSLMRGLTVTKEPIKPYTSNDKANRFTVGTSTHDHTEIIEASEDDLIAEGTVKEHPHSDKLLLVKQRRGWKAMLKSQYELENHGNV